MKGVSRRVLLVSALVLVAFAETGSVQAQTKKTVSGQHDPTPYISHAELQGISVEGRSVSGKSSGSQLTFRDILTVSSLEEVTRRFGEPTSTECKRAPEGMSLEYIAHLTYDGLDLKYRKRGEKIRLETLAITSESWFLRIGGMKFQPGMSTDSLSTVMRKEVEDNGDGVVAVTVAPPGKSEDSRSIRDSHTEIQFWTTEDRSTVQEVRFHRIAP